jgi:hypothetical protein
MAYPVNNKRPCSAHIQGDNSYISTWHIQLITSDHLVVTSKSPSSSFTQQNMFREIYRVLANPFAADTLCITNNNNWQYLWTTYSCYIQFTVIHGYSDIKGDNCYWYTDHIQFKLHIMVHHVRQLLDIYIAHPVCTHTMAHQGRPLLQSSLHSKNGTSMGRPLFKSSFSLI